jgi:hypothetical protein
MSLVTELNPSRKSINPEFEEVYREYSELAYRTVKGILGTVEDAEDVLQVIFVRLLGSNLTPSVRQNLKSYLYRAAVNQSLVTGALSTPQHRTTYKTCTAKISGLNALCFLRFLHFNPPPERKVILAVDRSEKSG